MFLIYFISRIGRPHPESSPVPIPSFHLMGRVSEFCTYSREESSLPQYSYLTTGKPLRINELTRLDHLESHNPVYLASSPNHTCVCRYHCFVCELSREHPRSGDMVWYQDAEPSSPLSRAAGSNQDPILYCTSSRNEGLQDVFRHGQNKRKTKPRHATPPHHPTSCTTAPFVRIGPKTLELPSLTRNIIKKTRRRESRRGRGAWRIHASPPSLHTLPHSKWYLVLAEYIILHYQARTAVKNRKD
ncbi:hypothetical protein BKA61DRAFT_92640 [Leptodontidium sp. MPI-SDFR-AT-0119]|nr:hypothetical protein BKA61DRAFT_92640 [Leptodontidium sp. MPI-SDFR-AT-0119]